MLNIVHTNWLIAVGIALIFSIIASEVFHTWQKHKLCGGGQRAVARLRKLEHGNQLDPAQVETLIQEICEHEGPLNPERATRPALPQQRGSGARKSLNCESKDLDEVDALVREILEHEEPLQAGLTARPQPLPIGASVRAVVDGGRDYAKRVLLN